MRKKLKIAGAVLLGLVAVVLGVGLVLPGEWRVARSVTIDARPEIVFWFVSTLDGWNDWTAWVKAEDPSMTVTPSGGPAGGVGMAYAWESKMSGRGTFMLTESVPPARVAYDLRFTDADILLHGSFVLAPAGAGTTVTWTEVGDIGHNPVARWMGVMFAGDVGDDFERGLAHLKERAEWRARAPSAATAAPAPAPAPPTATVAPSVTAAPAASAAPAR